MRQKKQARRQSSGQSTIEYILLVTAVVAVAILITGGKDSLFQKRLSNTINITTNGMETIANSLTSIIGRP